MKVVHLCGASFFPDNYAYQENLLPKYHGMMGHDVEVIASLVNFDSNGKCYCDKAARTYANEYGIKVVRLKYICNNPVFRKLRVYRGMKRALEAAAPDILFIHGIQFLSVFTVIRYLKAHPKVVVYADNHADFSNSATNVISRYILHGLLWKACAQALEPYVKMFWGVLPARVEFLVNQYGLPKEKTGLLIMGADDDAITRVPMPETRNEIRRRHGVGDDEMLVITGGKIDLFKTQTLLLCEAVHQLADRKIKLIVFGSVVAELKEALSAHVGGAVAYIGWLGAQEIYQYLMASDLAVFPGRHSVLWEQACGVGLPLVVRFWEGTTHVDAGGNCLMLKTDSADEIREVLANIRGNDGLYQSMKESAQENKKRYMYSQIAKKAIGED